MRRILLLAAALLLLCGCSKKTTVAMEYVDDAEEARSCLIEFELPEDVILQTESEDGTQSIYESADGNYLIAAETVAADTLEDAVREVSGFRMDDLTVLSTDLEDAEVYHFAWASESEEGTLVSRCALAVRDGAYCALTMTQKAGMEGAYRETEKTLFSSLSMAPEAE